MKVETKPALRSQEWEKAAEVELYCVLESVWKCIKWKETQSARKLKYNSSGRVKKKNESKLLEKEDERKERKEEGEKFLYWGDDVVIFHTAKHNDDVVPE